MENEKPEAVPDNWLERFMAQCRGYVYEELNGVNEAESAEQVESEMPAL